MRLLESTNYKNKTHDFVIDTITNAAIHARIYVTYKIIIKL